jgi:hypothetical protein
MGADQLTHHLASGKHEDRGHRPDRVLGTRGRVFGGVNFDDPNPTLVRGGEVVQDGRDLPTGWAVITPKVYENGKPGLENLRRKSLVSDVSEFSHPIPPAVRERASPRVGGFPR